MHELPVINRILEVILKHAASNDVRKVIVVHLQVGELSDLEDKWMQRYFDHLAKDGIAEGAKLEIERVPVMMKCSECGMLFTVNIREIQTISCPECKSKKSIMVSGQGYFIKNLEGI